MRGCRQWIDIDAPPRLVKANHTRDHGEQSVIFASFDTPARMKLSTTLADQDAAGGHEFTGESFDTQMLWI